MANLNVTAYKDSFYIEISNLQYQVQYYTQFAFQVGAYPGNSPNLVLNVPQQAGNTNYSFGIVMDRYDSNSYIECGTNYVISAGALYSGNWNTIPGSGSAHSTLACTSRPSNWSWPFSVASGQDCYVNATDWIAFQDRINEFRQYKNLSNYSFTKSPYVASGQPFYAWLANQAVTAISQMSPPTSPPATVSSLDDFTADWLNQLTNSLNSIQ